MAAKADEHVALESVCNAQSKLIPSTINDDDQKIEKNDNDKIHQNEPSDHEIIGFSVKKLKEYIKKNNSVHAAIACDKEKSIGIDKDELRFMALDSKPCGWTKSRLINLRRMKPQFRRHLMNKIKSFQNILHITDIELKTELFIMDCNEEKSKEMDQIIDEFGVSLKTITEQQCIEKVSPTSNDDDIDINDEKEQPETYRNREYNDEISSVSTHSSMPSLMSDDESDDDFDDDLDDSSDSPLQKMSDSDNETKGNVLDYNSSDEEGAKQNEKEITKGYNQKKNRKKSLSEQTVETWLLSSGLSASTCTKLIKNGYDTIDLFAVCSEDDIGSICAEFNLSNAERLKLKAAINGLNDDQKKKKKVTFKKGDRVIYDAKQYEVVAVSDDKISIKTCILKKDFHKLSHV